MRITKIEVQKKNPQRRNIYADDKFVAGVSTETLLRLGLRTGDEITAGVLESLQQAEELQSAKQVALRFLSHRPRTEREIRDRLREKEFADDDIAATIDELKRLGLVNDQQFAQMYVRDALARRPVGRLLLRQKMLLLGLERQLVDETLNAAFDDDTAEQMAREAAQQFLRRRAMRKEDPLKLRNGVAQFLMRRGFSWNVIQPILNSLPQTNIRNNTDE